MKLGPLLFFVLVALVPASAHPPSSDDQNACQEQGYFTPAIPGTGVAPVVGVLSYFDDDCWGSHAMACPAPPFEGPIPGAYCGPTVEFEEAVVCNGQRTTTDVIFAFGWDVDGDGLILDSSSESVSEYPGSNVYVFNPTASSARVILYPSFMSAKDPDFAQVNLVACL